MGIIAAKDRLDVTAADISEQPDSRYILMYKDMPFAVDDVVVTETGIAVGVIGAGRGVVVSFHPESADWLLVNRSVVRLATKEDLARASLDLSQLHEDILKKHRPDEFKAYEAHKSRALGIEGPDQPRGYL